MFNSKLPNLTKSQFFSPLEAREANKCSYMIQGRSYTAPLGMSINSDLKSGPTGIYEWVKLDRGYALRKNQDFQIFKFVYLQVKLSYSQTTFGNSTVTDSPLDLLSIKLSWC